MCQPAEPRSTGVAHDVILPVPAHGPADAWRQAMNEVTRDRIWRKLQVLPEAQLYQVLDYIEFLEARYAAGLARRPDGIQRFAERLEDSMRIRSVAPRVISGTVGAIGTARRIVQSVTDAGRDLLTEATRVIESPPAAPAVEHDAADAPPAASLPALPEGATPLDTREGAA
jgi:hypothetical protein